MLKKFITIIFVIFIVLASEFLSWAVVCGILKLISMCFGTGFNLKIATGIWLILMLLKAVFKSQDKR